MSDPSLDGTGYGSMPNAGGGPTGTNGNADDNWRKQQEQQARDDAAAAAQAAAQAADEQYKSHYEYGGWSGGAAEAAGRYARLGSDAQGRQGAQINTGNINADRGLNLGARSAGVSMADLLAARANGSMPSIAGMRANQDISRALADQSSVAASARGPAALALAQQNQANNSAAAMGNISNSAQINTAQEQLNNTVAAGQAYNSVRAGDQGLQGADAATAISQAQMDNAKADSNDRYQLGMTGYETGVQGAQLQAQGNQIAGERGAYATQQGIDLAHDQNSTAKAAPWIAGGLGAGAAVAGAVVSGLLGSSKGGPAPAAPGAVGPSGGSTSGDPGAGGGGSGGSYDPSTGMPVSGAGGGYNPDGSDPWKPSPAVPPVPAPPPPPPGGAPSTSYKPYDPNKPPLSDDRAKTPTSLATTHVDTQGPASSSVSMARMLAARDAEAERKAKAKEYGGLVSSTISGLSQAFAQQPQAHFTPTVAPQQPITLSDDRAKAAAWDEGHNAALDKVQQMRTMTPEQLKALGEKGNRLANAVRGAKADAYDEAKGRGGSIMQPTAPPRVMQFQRNDADYAAPPPPPMPADMAPMDSQGPVALSDARTKNRAEGSHNRSRNGRSAGENMGYPADGGDIDSLGPSGEGNRDEPDYNYVKTGSPLDVSYALEQKNGSISPETEAYMRREGMWGQKTDALLKDRGLRTTSDAQAKRPLETTSATRKATPGAVEEGNINHYGRPEVDNGDGTRSTVRSMSFSDGPGREVLIPTAYDGAVHSEADAIAHYRQTGQHMGVFKGEHEATAHALKVHDDYENGRYADAGSRVLEERPKHTTSDGNAKLSMSSMLSGSRRQVGTLGKEVSSADMADFARSLRSTPYSYKPEYAAREGQAPGEVNVGPVAQEIEKSKVGATIVKHDTQGSGMRTLDQTKMVKGLGGVAAAHQDKLDEHDRTLSLMARRLGGAQ
jgi:hypothetical protein